MPTLIRKLTKEGLQPVPYSADSLADAVQYEPTDGVYTVTNTVNTTQVLKMNAHLDRMEDSAKRIKIDLHLDRPRLRAALRTMIAEAGFGSVRFRVTAGREHPDELLLTIEPFSPPAPNLLEKGVHCATVPNSARANAAAKTTSWMHERGALTSAVTADIYEPLLLDPDGSILEGRSSNFYAILNGELRTAGAGVLPGIAQQIIYEIAPTVLPLNKTAINIAELAQISEAFLTSSSRGIIPIVVIDAAPVGAGTPGAVTRALLTAYHAWVAAHLEDL